MHIHSECRRVAAESVIGDNRFNDAGICRSAETFRRGRKIVKSVTYYVVEVRDASHLTRSKEHVEDPAGQPIDAVRPIVDDIDQRVQALLAELTNQATQ